MHVAILVTNTDSSDFAARHPRDAEKFTRLLGSARPHWRISSFDLTAGEFPQTLAGFDGVVIGGSPASVHDDAPWIAPLMDLIRQAAATGVPLFGACFGHQAIALALGGQVTANPDGWVFGAVESRLSAPAPWIDPDATGFTLAAAHSEQVSVLPPGATVLATSDGCPVAAYRIGTAIFATQHHPEIAADFLAGLVAEYAAKLPPDVAARARASLSQPLDGRRFAEWAARFFELSA